MGVSSCEDYYVGLADYLGHTLCLWPTGFGEVDYSIDVDMLRPRCEVDLTAFGVNDWGVDDACSDLVDDGWGRAVWDADVGDGVG